MKVKLNLYKQNRYLGNGEIVRTVIFEDVKAWEIRRIPDAEIIKSFDQSSLDDDQEYLELTFEDGEKSTYRNSYVDLFYL